MTLDAKLPEGTHLQALSVPSRTTLQRKFVHALDVVTRLPRYERCPHLEEIVTLRPGFTNPLVRTGFYSPDDSFVTYNGYYAVSARRGRNIVFSVHVPHAAISDDFPPKTLRNAVGQFMLRLVEEGYSVHKIKYLVP